ncbi:sodium:solute symporter family protein [Brevibacillus reuszeri]|uniref:sodium:solute symporter family protein n=1 Tax=Brevibacillus reuszeri TaxID=54915 RepID=UPI00289E3508|nr:sodium:solute symporter [Brevibacillus reuszeri]
MNSALLIITAFMALSIYLALRARRGKEMTLEQWSVGNRGLGSMLVFLLMAGEAFTTFTFLGASGFTYAAGAPAFYIFNAAYFVLSYWLLPPIWKYAKEKKLLSQSDFFASKYNSTALGVLVAIVGVISMIPYLVLQLKGLGIIVSEASYGTVSPSAAIWIGVLTVTVYVMLSGIHGAAWTAVLKDFLILGVVIFMGFYLPLHYHGGFVEMFKSIDQANPGFLVLPESGLSTYWFVSTLILWSLGSYMWPHTFSAAYAAKSGKALRRNAILMPMYQIVLVFVIFIGFAAIFQVPGLKGSDTDLVLFKLSKATFDPWFVGVIGAAGILAALVPSSMMLNVAATILSKNVYKIWKPDTTDASLVRLTRYLVPVVAIAALYFTFNGGNTIVTLLIMGYSLVTQLFPALFFSLWKKNPVTVQGAFCGIIAGLAAVLYTTLSNASMADLFPSMPQTFKDFDIGIIAFTINVIVTLAVSAFTRKAVNKETEPTQSVA